MARIAVESLTKSFGAVRAVDDLSFTAEPGQVTGFLGPNGSGKSTTIRAILGLVHPTSGGATIDGTSYQDLERPAEVVGAALEATAFHPGRSGRNHLRCLAVAAGLPETRVDEVLALVDLTDAGRRRAGGYSLGMKQRLALASALLGDPRVLILDEPANGLDPEGIRWLRNFLRARAEEGRTVLVSSHVLSEIEQVAHSVVIIDKGRLVRQSGLHDLQNTAASSVVVRSPGADSLAALAEQDGGQVERSEGTLRIRGLSQERIGELAAASGIVLHELRSEQATLEGAFLDLTGGDSTPNAGGQQ